MPSPDSTDLTSSITCGKAGRCRAPLCPIDSAGPDHRQVWYPDEPICSLEEFQEIDWIVRQRDIAAKAGSSGGFFTLRMLKSLRTVRDGVLGMDPDSSPSQRRRLKQPGPRSSRIAVRSKGKTERQGHTVADGGRPAEHRRGKEGHGSRASARKRPTPPGTRSAGSSVRTKRRLHRPRAHRMNASRKVL